MSMISRYQKSGGFIQLLQLVETCGKQKQDNFLSIIEKEDKRWAQAIREKMLTVEKVFSWDETVLAEIAARLQQLTIATAIHGLKPADSERLLKTFSHSQKRAIDDLKNSKSSSPAEINSAFLKILQEVRNMITHGYLRLEKIAPEMVIPDDYEDKLGKGVLTSSKANDSDVPNMDGFGPSPAAPHAAAHGPAYTPSAPSQAGSGADAEMAALRAKLQALLQENATLKTQVRMLQEKISQIKKIA